MLPANEWDMIVAPPASHSGMMVDHLSKCRRSQTVDGRARLSIPLVIRVIDGHCPPEQISLVSEEAIHQPDDKLFKAGFSDPANAAAFLGWEVPPALSEKIACDQLRLEPGSFVDSHYRHTESDLLSA